MESTVTHIPTKLYQLSSVVVEIHPSNNIILAKLGFLSDVTKACIPTKLHHFPISSFSVFSLKEIMHHLLH